jgi:hypothetical protein
VIGTILEHKTPLDNPRDELVKALIENRKKDSVTRGGKLDSSIHRVPIKPVRHSSVSPGFPVLLLQEMLDHTVVSMEQ